ncbi:zinc finger SWIM domain protein [Methanocaldococcus infernus ME]|uniref:Zinc finger SWIM domain protein n=1 Tax=Methanocaldococcus infernus (strain DSM 11812 / JCM 15783 / ME) TaxID=573063 RepID=D5VSG3_METIM|nr:SWIM zinc finger family protein [Methanocaldococcus infernus]ADG13516.1 zinc finger SWIM domain protein [Methanocaldococcus infernus ME]
MYDEIIKRRGEHYYKSGLVKYCVKLGNYLYGKVIGSEEYKVKVNLKDLSGLCSCPYKYNCKHAYALILAYKNNDYIDGELIFKELKEKDKEEIIKILKDIVVKEFLWEQFLGEESLLKKAQDLIKIIPLERKNIYTFISFLRNVFINRASDEELLKLIELMIKNDIEEEECYFIVVEEIFKRDNIKTKEKLYKLYKKHPEKLWMVDEFIEIEGF